VSPNDYRRAGEAAGGDASAHDLVDARESRCGHSDGLGRDMRQSSVLDSERRIVAYA
jgi:hypothetical protein